MNPDAVLAFWSVSLLVIVVPGADWAFTISAGLRGRSVWPAVAGLVTGYALITAVVAAGVGALVTHSPELLTVLTVVGGLYLIWHGITTLTAGVSSPATLSLHGNVFFRGVGVSGLNPKGLLIFLALLPQFTTPRSGWPIGVQIAILGLTFTATCAVFYLLLGTVARTALTSRPTLARTVTRLSGVAMAAIGAALLIDNFIS